ncbi:MAG: hypothetical protein H0W12_01915 [Chitinophagaceae bacterium]|nr:hypothetical protein [Chitinophagaceae bacterium]
MQQELANHSIDKFTDVRCKSKSAGSISSYRGFVSIDQEMEREIALQWFTNNKYSEGIKAFVFYRRKG